MLDSCRFSICIFLAFEITLEVAKPSRPSRPGPGSAAWVEAIFHDIDQWTFIPIPIVYDGFPHDDLHQSAINHIDQYFLLEIEMFHSEGYASRPRQSSVYFSGERSQARNPSGTRDIWGLGKGLEFTQKSFFGAARKFCKNLRSFPAGPRNAKARGWGLCLGIHHLVDATKRR